MSAPGGPLCESTERPAIDSPLGPPNDLAEGAIDVSGGGMFMLDLSNAHDDVASGCAPDRPDVLYRISLSQPEVIYLDTFGTRFDTAIAIRSGDCAVAGEDEACVDDSCGGAQTQGAWNLPAGEHCIVVEGSRDALDASGQLVVVRGRRTGDPLVGASGTVSGDTCDDDNRNNANCGCEPANDHHYFFTACPDSTVMAHIETCGLATWDTVLQLRDSARVSFGCTDDSCGSTEASTLTRMVTGPGLFWAIIDGCDDCGAYQMAYTLMTSTL